MKQKRWKREQLAIAIRAMQMEASKETKRFQASRRFVEDHFPCAAARVAWCSRSFEVHEDQLVPGTIKLLPRRCHQVPYCILCNRVAAVRRTIATLNKINRCTPEGRMSTFWHCVQTAPVTDKGEGWGMQASNNVPGFGRVVMKALEEALGKGIGVVMSYQDFGEQAFAKRHPHMDFTLSGWMLQDGQPVKTPYLEMKGGGRARFDERIVKHAQQVAIGARKGDFRIDGPFHGNRAFFRILKYQMRELVDLRKLEYSREAGIVWWKDYKRNRRTPMTVDHFLDGLADYEKRLGTWRAGPGAQRLHRAHGHLADRSVKQSQAAMGGQTPPHGRQCVCYNCGDWTELELTEEEEAMNRPAPLARMRLAC